MSAKIDQAVIANTASTIVLDVIDRAQTKLRQARSLPEQDEQRQLLLREVEALRDEAKNLTERFSLIK
jgi:C4-type Zn-finger protein